jgi:DNA-binding beta-propeller fold protein YncE
MSVLRRRRRRLLPNDPDDVMSFAKSCEMADSSEVGVGRRGSGAVATAVALIAATACSNSVGPSPPFREPIALVRICCSPDLDETHRFLAIGLNSRRKLTWSEPVSYRISGTAISPDRRTLVAIGSGADGWTESQIVAVDTRLLTVRWRQPLADSTGYLRDSFGGIAVHTTTGMAVSPDGTRLFIADAEKDGNRGVAVLDMETRVAVGFIGNFTGGSMLLAMVPPGDFRAGGAVAIRPVGSTGALAPGASLVIVDPTTLEVLDSVDLSQSLLDPGDGILDMEADPDGAHLFLRTSSGWLLKYDLTSRNVVNQARVDGVSCLRCLTVAPDGQRVYVAQSWNNETPSPGLISVFDAQLQASAAIDLSGVRVEQYGSTRTDPPALNHVGVASDGTLLVATGAMLAQLWGFQTGAIYFIDPDSGAILDVIRLQGELAAVEVIFP